MLIFDNFLRKEKGWAGFPRSDRVASRAGGTAVRDFTKALGPTETPGSSWSQPKKQTCQTEENPVHPDSE